MGMVTVDRAAAIIDNEIKRVAEQRGVPYGRALGLLRDERPSLFTGFYRVYRSEREQRERIVEQRQR